MEAPLIVAHNGSAFLGGAELWTARLMAALKTRGYRVLVLCKGRAMVGQFERVGVPAKSISIGGQLMLPHAVTFAATLCALKPSALLLTTFKKIWLAGLGASIARVPRVVARVGMSTDLPNRHWTYGVALRRWIDQTVVNADEIRVNFLDGLGQDYDPTRVITIYNGVSPPLREQHDGALRRELRIPPDSKVVGTLARLNVQKRLDLLLDAVSRMDDGTHCVVAGEGDQRESLTSQSHQLGIQDRVHLVGHRADVGEVLSALDLLVLTSDREGMSNAMLEAMAFGVPVLTTPVSGAAEALEPLEDGRMPGRIVSQSADAIATAADDLLSDPRRLAEMGNAGAQRAKERFAFEDKVNQWVELLVGDAGSVKHEGPSDLRLSSHLRGSA